MLSSDSSTPVITEWFWDVLAQANNSRDTLRRVLTRLGREEILRFAREFEYAAAELTIEPYTRYMEYNSDDDVEDVAKWVVSQGKQYYERVIQNPELTPICFPGGDTMLDGVAQEVFHEKHDEGMPHTAFH